MGKFSGTGFNYNEEGVTTDQTMEDILLGTNSVGETVISATDNLEIDTSMTPAPKIIMPEPVIGQDEGGGGFEMKPEMSEEEQAQSILHQQSHLY